MESRHIVAFFGSAWPAVCARAAPVRPRLLDGAGSLPASTLWAQTAITAATVVAAAAVIAPRERGISA